MRVPLFWLKDYVDIDHSAEELAEALTMAGLPVEGIERFGAGVTGVVAGRIVSLELVPETHLRLCQVELGVDQVVPIVTGAPNVQVGDYVPVAVPGATLAGGQVIETAELHGIRSEGMLCSAAELGLSEKEADGIMILPEAIAPGTDLTGPLYLGEAVLEFELTANRADCLSMLGIAREVAAVCGGKLKAIPVDVPVSGARVQDLAAVTVLAVEACPRYVARVATGLRSGRAPLAMQQRLRAAGMRPISAVVDITNFVMLELGQPLHAFDLEALAHDATGRPHIVVRKAGSGERLVTLDGAERHLQLTDLLITDGKRAVAVAGVMGGADSEVTPSTGQVLLESALFDSATVRRTAKRLGLRSEASNRFEKGIDPDVQVVAADRAMRLLHEVCGATVAQGCIDEQLAAARPRTIKLRPARVNALLGTTLSDATITGYLRRLPGVVVAAASPGSFVVTVPTFRWDLEGEADLAEEVARLHGYDNIPSTVPCGLSVDPSYSPTAVLEEKVRRALLAAGLWEAITGSLVGKGLFDVWQLPEGSPLRRTVDLLAPLSEEQAVLRTSLLPSLGLALKHNLSRRQTNVRLFEVGRVFRPQEPNTLPVEPRHVAALLTGEVGADTWNGRRGTVDFFDAKGVVEAMLSALGLTDFSFQPVARPGFHPGRTAEVLVNGLSVGVVGELHPEVQEALDAPARVGGFELSLDALVATHPTPVEFKALPRYPAVTRDLALVLPETVTAEGVAACIRLASADLLEEVRLFDVYRGANIPAGQRSLAFALTLRASDRTLTENEVSGTIAAIMADLTNKFGATLR